MALTMASLPHPPSWQGVCSPVRYTSSLLYSPRLIAYRCAHLDVVFTNRCPVVHSIEGSDFVHTHWWHLQQSRNLIHDAQARESMLPLSKIQQWHHSGLLILWGVALQNLLNELVILLCELEWDVWVIIGRVTVLYRTVRHHEGGSRELWRLMLRLTTWRASLDTRTLAVNDRHWGLDAIRDARNAGLNRYGESLDAIVAVLRRNGDLSLKVVLRLAHYCQASASIWPRYDWRAPRAR